MPLTLAVRRVGDATVIAIGGDVDVETAPQLREALADAIGANAGERVVVDLAGTDFLDSSALGVLVGASKQLESKHAGLTVVCTKQHLLRVFELTRLDQVISIVATVEAAVAAV